MSLLIPVPSLADPAEWLISGSKINPELETPEYLTDGIPLHGDELLGKLLFNSSTLLGEKATRIGLSCNSCHPSGHRNASFFIPGLSDIAGRVDMTHSFWHENGSDQTFNPLEIPSLRGIAHTAPYGTAISKPTLTDFTHHVISTEFGGPAPSSDILNALGSYMKRLQLPLSDAIAAEPVSFTRYLELLKRPISVGDTEKVTHIIYLLREDLGRRAALEPQNASYANTAKMLRNLANISPSYQSIALEKLLELQKSLTF